MGKADLHIHTTESDGKYTPTEIVRKARDSGLTHIAICDHDIIDGVLPAQEAARNFEGLTVIAGVEINTDTDAGELHMLGYLFDCFDSVLSSTLKKMRHSRVERAQKMIDKLRRMGIKIPFERVEEVAGPGSIGRPHIAQVMLEKGYISNVREAFVKYIGHGGPAYVERDKLTPVEAIRLIAGAKGIPVLAHPLFIDNFEALLNELKSAGLRGLEVYYGNYSPEQVQGLRHIADSNGLISTGGSDFHGIDETTETPLGSVEVPMESVERLLALASR
jgi:predicted metal-dependent phosphoesterase TrpH